MYIVEEFQINRKIVPVFAVRLSYLSLRKLCHYLQYTTLSLIKYF